MAENSEPQRFSRRTLLLSVAGVVVGAAEMGMLLDSGSPKPAGQLARLVEADSKYPLPAITSNTPILAVSKPAPVSVKTTVPAWAKRWKTPIEDLGDFLRRMPGHHFPDRAVMMTVDDGPNDYWTPRYLKLFEKYHVTATFNMIGAQVPSRAKLVRAIASQGHTLANHTWSHDLYLPERGRPYIHGEIARTNDAIERASGIRPQIFRSPGGAWGPRIFDELAHEHMMPLGWDIDPRDWARPGVEAITSSMLQARPGDIILCHDGGGDRSETFAALERVIPALKKRGYRFVTLPGQ